MNLRRSRRLGSEGEDRTLMVMVIPDGGRRTRTIVIPYSRLRWLVPVLGFLGLLAVLMIGSWGFLVVRANRVTALEGEVIRLLTRESRVEELAQSLAEVEGAYDHLRSLFGPSAPPEAGDLWLPPATARPEGRTAVEPDQADLPSGWPLTQRGFITQALPMDGSQDHPGIDIAVPSGSYIRAAGGGVVSEIGEDRVYGNFIVLDHGSGYRTRYAHTSSVLATAGDPVRRNEVIALSGSSGRSTAPHLHFEILHEGDPVDPLTLVTQP